MNYFQGGGGLGAVVVSVPAQRRTTRSQGPLERDMALLMLRTLRSEEASVEPRAQWVTCLYANEGTRGPCVHSARYQQGALAMGPRSCPAHALGVPGPACDDKQV